MFIEIFNQLGRFGTVILNIISVYLLWDKETLLFYYVIGVCLDLVLNVILKGIIQMPRPSVNIRTFNLALSRGRRVLFKDGMLYDIFGMPSGHAQSALFSTIFIYCALKKMKFLYGYLIMSCIVMFHRVYFNHHSFLQVLVGAIVGSVMAFFVYYLARQKIKGRITAKMDDYAPV